MQPCARGGHALFFALMQALERGSDTGSHTCRRSSKQGICQCPDQSSASTNVGCKPRDAVSAVCADCYFCHEACCKKAPSGVLTINIVIFVDVVLEGRCASQCEDESKERERQPEEEQDHCNGAAKLAIPAASACVTEHAVT